MAFAQKLYGVTRPIRHIMTGLKDHTRRGMGKPIGQSAHIPQCLQTPPASHALSGASASIARRPGAVLLISTFKLV